MTHKPTIAHSTVWACNRGSLTHACTFILPKLTHLPWTKWPPFRGQYFQMHRLESKCMDFDNNVTEVCSYGSNWHYLSIGLDNGWRRPSHYLNQCWPDSRRHICDGKGRWINSDISVLKEDSALDGLFPCQPTPPTIKDTWFSRTIIIILFYLFSSTPFVS